MSHILTSALLGDVWPPCDFSKIAKKRRRAATPFCMPYQPSFPHLFWKFCSAPLCIGGENLSIQMVIVCKLIDIKRCFMNENEANKQYIDIIRWLPHIGDWATHSMTKTVKFGQNWLSKGLLRQFVSRNLRNRYHIKISASNYIRKNAGSKTLRQKVKKGVTLLCTFCKVRSDFQLPCRSVFRSQSLRSPPISSKLYRTASWIIILRWFQSLK